ncbi:MAG: class I SAM-dependent methyltransferase [Planctomycetia bacterium]
MSLASDLKVLYHMALRPIRGKTHAERLESFYEGQAGAYDDFRKRLLHGREEMCRALPLEPGTVWVDMGGGTGSNLEYVADRLPALSKAYVVDLSKSLLKRCDERCAARGWTNVATREADVTEFRPDEGTVDVVTFSYSLTMIPDWFAAVEQAERLLKPGGTIGVVDFYVSRKFPADGFTRHPWRTRTFWPLWFGNDNVHPNPDHVPFLHRKFDAVQFHERRAKIAYLPLVRAPYYIFQGRKRGGS